MEMEQVFCVILCNRKTQDLKARVRVWLSGASLA
jgi:hypothetical protein